MTAVVDLAATASRHARLNLLWRPVLVAPAPAREGNTPTRQARSYFCVLVRACPCPAACPPLFCLSEFVAFARVLTVCGNRLKSTPTTVATNVGPKLHRKGVGSSNPDHLSRKKGA
eukprot:2865976-Prymnesium_polylepis.1